MGVAYTEASIADGLTGGTGVLVSGVYESVVMVRTLSLVRLTREETIYPLALLQVI
jgi:hypothetical protein